MSKDEPMAGVNLSPADFPHYFFMICRLRHVSLAALTTNEQPALAAVMGLIKFMAICRKTFAENLLKMSKLRQTCTETLSHKFILKGADTESKVEGLLVGFPGCAETSSSV